MSRAVNADHGAALIRCLELAHRRLDLRDRGLPPHLPGDQVPGVAGHQAPARVTPVPRAGVAHLRIVA